MSKFLIIILIVLPLTLPLAYGHPFTEETVPQKSSNVPVSTNEIIVHYSEALELDFSELKVFDSNGNQVDNKDTSYFEGESSLIVTTPPLEEGIYTVTSKVLSKVDGHLVDDAFVFAVGSAKVDPSLLERHTISETLYLPDAGARFPGLLGQTIVLGAAIASLMVWGTQNKQLIKKSIEKFQSKYHDKFIKLIGTGLILVFASNILMMIVQTMRLETSAFDVLETNFGNTWIFRMIITVILLGVWFWMERQKELSVKNQFPLLIFSLILISTTTLLGHGTASEQQAAIVLDYAHNLVAAVWIGGLIYFVFALLPSFLLLEDEQKEKMSLAAIPRFSIMFTIIIGIIVISGPTLLWFLEDDVNLIIESTYGKLIFAKITLFAAMMTVGGYNQFMIVKREEKNIKSGVLKVHNKLRRSLKVESSIGIALLGVVALLANGSLPAGEIQQAEAQEVVYGLRTMEFSELAKFDINIEPFTSGQNTIRVIVSDYENNALFDIESVKMKVSNPQRNIAPIEIPMTKLQADNLSNEFEGELTFGFSGQWLVEIEAQRTQTANEVVSIDLLVKPRLQNIQTEIIEYEFPEFAGPLYPLYDGKGSIWISDSTAPRLWKFTIDDQQFKSYEFEGQVSVSLAIDSEDKIWFTDTPSSKIGFLNPKTEKIQIISLPQLEPTSSESRPVFIESDADNNIWISVVNKNVILKYNQKNKDFEKFYPPTSDSGPFGLLYDSGGKIWFTQTQVSQIGYVDLNTKEVKEFKPNFSVTILETLTFDKDGNIWISEHNENGGIVKFNPVLETFEKIPSPSPTALPNDPTFDKYQNIWFAQHTVDKLGLYDPHNGDLIQIPVPTQTSFIQFMTSDDNDNIWFVEQRGNKIGTIKITEIPIPVVITEQKQLLDLKYAEIVSPLMVGGIIMSSLFFVKNVRDKRRINSMIFS